jgi:hypothetical protein
MYTSKIEGLNKNFNVSTCFIQSNKFINYTKIRMMNDVKNII